MGLSWRDLDPTNHDKQARGALKENDVLNHYWRGLNGALGYGDVLFNRATTPGSNDGTNHTFDMAYQRQLARDKVSARGQGVRGFREAVFGDDFSELTDFQLGGTEDEDLVDQALLTLALERDISLKNANMNQIDYFNAPSYADAVGARVKQTRTAQRQPDLFSLG